MAEEELESEGEAGGLPETGGQSKLVKALIIVAIILFSLIVVFVISYFVAKSVQGARYEENLNKTVVKAPPPLATWKFPQEFRINTSDTESSHFVKMQVALAYEQGQLGLEAELTKRNNQMRDLINIIIQGKQKRELTGALNQLTLREEIKAQLNHILRDGLIRDVYLPEFIVN